MADTYTTKGLPPAPQISMTTIPMAGLLVDVYGLEELAPSVPLTCFWLLHPRLRTRARMADIAKRVVSTYNASAKASEHRLIALAFDMPNHGTRLVSESASESWKGGNATHAIDMMGFVKGGRRDMSGLMDLVAGYLGREVEGHVGLGWSLGGHAMWQGYMLEDRLSACVVIIGCPDYVTLMEGRAKVAGLQEEDKALLGSKWFPSDLVQTCSENDPKSLLFGREIPGGEATTGYDIGGLKGKKLLLCSGGDDELVPHRCGTAFLKGLRDLGVEFDDRVYPGVGHHFPKEMVEDTIEFLVDAVGREEAQRRAHL